MSKGKGYLNRSCELIGEYESHSMSRDTLLDLIIYRRE